MKKFPPRLNNVHMLPCEIKKRHISYFDNALLEQYLLHQAWCETWSSSSTAETNRQSWHKFKMSTFGL